VIGELLRRFPPGTPYSLSIGNVLQQTGIVDDPEASGDANVGESITLSGRDAIAKLVDGRIVDDASYTNETYSSLLRTVADEVYGPGYPISFTNEQNRMIQVGGEVIQSDLPPDPETTQTGATKERPIRAKAGESHYKFLRDQYDRGGLFLFAGADGRLILTAPNASQAPVARIVRGKGESLRTGQVKAFKYKNATSCRFTDVVIYSRSGGRKAGRTTTRGAYEDAEMIGYGFARPLVLRDHNSASAGQADALARRKIAESRRAGRVLSYTVAGHTTIGFNGRDRVVWAMDTVVDVDDQDLGVQGSFWVESVEMSRGPETNTTINLMRPEDLVFGTDEQ
jgi:prophage tail gpP-like protein